MNAVMGLQVKRKISTILRKKLEKKEIDEETMKRVKKDLFEVVNSAEPELISFIFSVMIDAEVSVYEGE